MKKRYWLRGGIIMLFLYGFITLVLMPFGTIGNQWFPLWIVPTFLGSIPLFFILEKYLGDYVAMIGSAIICYSLIGIIIGWIYGKIKNKKEIMQSVIK